MTKTKIGAAIIGSLLLLGAVSQAWAACPAGTRYVCTQGYNGKVICGCQ